MTSRGSVIREPWCWLLVATLSACAGETAGNVDGGRVDAGPTATTSTVCSFDLVDGATRTTVDGSTRSRMNGSGNLIVLCEATGGAELELRIGNATFDGVRAYHMDDFTSDGRINYDPGAELPGYTSRSDGGDCVVDVTEAAPLDVRGSLVMRGGHVAGTFRCNAMVGATDAVPPRYVVEAGSFTGTIE